MQKLLQVSGCQERYYFEIREPDPLTVVLDDSRTIQAGCPGDTATLYFNIVGGKDSPFTVVNYTLNLAGGLYNGTATSGNRTVVISGIDPAVLLAGGTNVPIELSDDLGCTPITSLVGMSLNIPQPVTVNTVLLATDIDCVKGSIG